MICREPTDTLVRFAEAGVLLKMQKMIMDVRDVECPTSASQAIDSSQAELVVDLAMKNI